MSSLPFIGEITMFPYVFTPENYLECSGAIVPIQQFTTLYAVIGPAFGGDARTTFGIPNLSGRTPLGSGTGPGLTPYYIGFTGGRSTVTLSPDELPQHSHNFTAVFEGNITDDVNSSTETLNRAQEQDTQTTINMYSTASTTPSNHLADESVTALPAGTHANRQPYLSMKFFIAMDGLFPTRS